MTGRLKVDEKNERLIRGLLKLPENRRCINCNSLGPQYVCINFWTFVCTTCSGIHREFTHRVKSVSMAKFTSQEVSALQGGGNASAKEIYLKEWDPQHNSLPDGSNVERLRNFIKHVYVERRYSSDRRFDKPARGKGETDDLNENNTYQGGPRSPPYGDCHNDKPIPGGRSPGYDQENKQYNGYKRSPARAEVINDWQRDDRFGNGRRSDESRSSDGSSTFESKSLDESASPFRVIEPPKENDGRSTDASVRTQRTASSSSLAPSNGNPADIKMETSLIDFDAVPEPLPTTASTLSQPISSGTDNWANFDSPQVKVSHWNTNPLDVLSDLAAPAPFRSHLEGTSGGAAPVGGLPGFSSSHDPAVVSPFGSFAAVAAATVNSAAFGSTSNAGGQWSNTQLQHPSLFPPTDDQSIFHLSDPVVGGPVSTQPWNHLAASSRQGLHNAVTAQVAHTVTNSALEATSEAKYIDRNALPEDLFTASYLPTHAPIPGWYAPPHGIGPTMQYNVPVPTASAQPLKSSNPFDTPTDPPPLQASTFPSMASVQGALPNIETPTGLQQTSNLGIVTPHPFGMPQQTLSYALPSSSYMGQQVDGSMPQKYGLL